MSSLHSQAILVTGGAGFIGSHLCKKLVAQGMRVIALDNFNSYYSPRLKRKNIQSLQGNPLFTLIEGSFLEDETLAAIFTHKIDSVVHLGAQAGVRESLAHPQKYYEVNVIGTLKLLEQVRQYQVQNFILASSSSVYGNAQTVPFLENQTLLPVSPYGSSKKAAEDVCRLYASLYGIPTTVLRFFTVYGPHGRPDMLPWLFTDAILHHRQITRYGSGRTTRDYTYIGDIVSGIEAALQHPFSFEIFNLGGSHPISLNAAIHTIESITGKKANILEKPIPDGEAMATFADTTHARRLLNWKAKTSFEEGMKKFVKWFRSEVLTANAELDMS